jgi:hypothetical protein
MRFIKQLESDDRFEVIASVIGLSEKNQQYPR